MKKLLIISLFFILITGCSFSPSPPSQGPTTLTIQNNYYSLSDARWNHTSFGPIIKGEAVTMDVTSGDKYIYLRFVEIYDKWFQIYPSIKINPGENKTFIFEYPLEGTWVPDPLKEF